MRRFVSLPLLLLAAACSDTTAPPRTRTLAAVRINGESTFPLVHYCTPAAPSTEQWVAAGSAQLIVYPDGTFQLDETDETGSAQYHMNGATKIYDQQSATGGRYGFAGTSADAGDGSRTLRFERATTIYGDASTFTGRILRDSAVVTHRMTCAHPTAPDSGVSFVIVLK